MEKKERNHNSYCELPEGEDVSSSSPAKSPAKRESRKGKENREIRILKKGKSIKEQRNDPERFSGEGICFRAKIIGTEHVLDARGNRMCQGALQRLKAAVKTSGDHKQKIILNISLDGIIIKDEKSEEQLHHHPIHKISFISQDTKDSRAFGYVYGCPQTGHRFFAIKTEKAASQVVVTLRDLFLVALEIKKSEIERTQHSETPEDIPESIQEEEAEKKNGHENGVSNENLEAACQENSGQGHLLNPTFLYSNMVLLPEEFVPESSISNTLLDLQSEVDILQQGISQMDHSIAFTVSQNLGISVSEDDVSESSSSSIPATSFHLKLDKLSSLYQETLSVSSRSSSTSDYNVCAPESKAEDHDTQRKDTALPPEHCSSGISTAGSNSTVSEETTSVVEDKYAVFLDIDSIPSIFDDPSIVKVPEEKIELPSVSSSIMEVEATEIKSSTPIAFAELDPLGDHPYVDKRDFFQDIKNPPKKVLNDLVNFNCDSFPVLETDVPFSSQENLENCDLKSRNQDNAFVSSGITSTVADPPKLPPKRCTGIFSEQQQDSTAWDSKNPFNPFLYEEYPDSDIPPPNSPPPPPPPRLPTKALDYSPTLSPPPPRPPSRVNGIPTPPLPKRKVPLSSANRTWFSFDQDAASSFPPTPFIPEVESTTRYAPPLPSPARKLPSSKPDSPLLLKSSSTCNSPATLRRLFNKSPLSGISVVADELDTKYSPKQILSQHSSNVQDNIAFVDEVINPFMESHSESSPPLPPKPSPLKKGDVPVSSGSSSSVSVIESSNGTPHSSSSLVYSSLDEGRTGGSSSEVLFTNSMDSGSDVFSQSSKETVQPQSSSDSTTLEKSTDVSPDSIFRRKSDPFADDFFLSLYKKDSPSITGCSNGVEYLDHVREPT